MKTECDTPSGQQLVCLRYGPRRVSEFDHRGDRSAVRAPWRLAKKVLESGEVDRECWRQLIEDRSKVATESCGSRQQPVQRLLRIPQPFHVRQKAAGFDREQESRRCLITPVRKRGSLGETVEGVVDFDAIELARVVLQPLMCTEPLRIETATSRRVVPS